MNKLYATLCLCTITIVVFSQIVFETDLGAIACYEEAFSATKINNEIYVSGNYNCNGGPTDYKSKLWKLNAQGVVVDSVLDTDYNGFMLPDENDFVFAGGSKAGLVYDTIVLNKIDASLNEIWQKKYQLGVCNNVVYDVQSVDDGYLYTGFYSTQNCAVAQYDAFVLKLDKQGNEQWLSPIGGAGNQQFYAVKQSANEIVAFGSTDNTPNGVEKYFITRFNLNGDSIASFIVDTVSSFKGYGMDFQEDYLIINGTRNNDEVVAMKINLQGDIIWQKNLGIPCGSSYYKAHYTLDKQYLFTYINSGALGCYTTLVKTDVDGNELWRKTFAATIRTVNEVALGSFLLAGFKLNANNFISDAYVAMFDTTFLAVSTTKTFQEDISLYPNPSNNFVSLQWNSNMLPSKIVIQNITGNIIYQNEIYTKEQLIDIKNFAAGVYSVTLKNAATYKTIKLIKTN